MKTELFAGAASGSLLSPRSGTLVLRPPAVASLSPFLLLLCICPWLGPAFDLKRH